MDVVVTGAMAQYIPTLDFYSGSLPLSSTAYASSESFFGINLHPFCDIEEIAYTIMPNLAYFEFLPYKSQENGGQAKEELQLVDLADVVVGKEYEMVVTTYSGKKFAVNSFARMSTLDVSFCSPLYGASYEHLTHTSANEKLNNFLLLFLTCMHGE